jgi:hypothetical protein
MNKPIWARGNVSIAIKLLEEALNGVASGFAWSATPKGGEYWNEVYHQLSEMRYTLIEYQSIPKDEGR